MNVELSVTAPQSLCQRAALALLSLCFVLGCARPSTPPVRARPVPAEALHRGPLTDYVPAAGLRWMLVGSPKRTVQSRAFADAIALLLPNDRLEAFARVTGVELRHVNAGLIAGFDFGNLYMFEPEEGSASRIIEHFRARLATDGERVERPHPDVLRISGVVDKRPQMLVYVAPSLIALASGDPTAARVVEAFARKKLLRSPPALRGAALSALNPPLATAIATFYAPGPFVGEWARGAHGLLADAVALSVSIAPAGERTAHVAVDIAGDFSPRGPDELISAVRELSESSTGKLLGLDQPASPAEVHEREGRLLLDIELDLDPLARGLRAAVIADVWEIMGLPAPAAD